MGRLTWITVLVVHRLVALGIVVGYIWVTVQFFKVTQIASAATPDLAPGWHATVMIVLSSTILPLYLYAILVRHFVRPALPWKVPYFIMGLLGVVNFVAAVMNLYRFSRSVDRGNEDDISTECIYSGELCTLPNIAMVLGLLLIGGTTFMDIMISKIVKFQLKYFC